MINKWKTGKIKRWNRRLIRKGLEIENYYIIESRIDKGKGIIQLSLRIPVSGQRQVDASFGPVGYTRKPKIKKWYWN
jgi:hypothetical protein